MESLARSPRIFRFGQFEADQEHNSLTRSGTRIKIQDQPFCVLILLLERPGEIVTREVLRQKLWPEGTHVDFDGSLNVIVKKLRAVIADDPENPRFIETVPRRGYRFIAPVSAIEVSRRANVHIADGSAAAGEASRHSARRVQSLLLAAAVLLAGAGWAIRNKLPVTMRKQNRAISSHDLPVTPRKSAAVLGFHNVSGKTGDAWLSTGLSEMLPALNAVLGLLENHPDSRWLIAGHTDNQGTAEHNQPLSEKRAAAVIVWLKEHGADASRLSSEGFGATMPVADNLTAGGRALNRRVEVALAK